MFDEDSEKTVLGSLLSDHELFSQVSEIIQPSDFYSNRNRLIYETIAESIDEGIEPDSLYIVSKIRGKGQLENAGGSGYIHDLSNFSSPLTVINVASSVRDLALRRTLLTNIKDVEKKVQNSEFNIETLLGDTEQAVFQVADRYSTNDIRHIRELQDEFIEYLAKIKEAQGKVTGLATHFSEFDKMTSGMHPGQLLIVAARPGVGKTTFALNIAKNAAVNEKAVVLFFSLEMPRIDLLVRMICSYAGVDSGKLRRGNINEKDTMKMVNAANKFYETDFYFDDYTGLTIWDLKQRSRRLASTLKTKGQKLGLIIVDYLQLMSTPATERSDSRQQQVASISRGLKLIAKELEVPVIALSQMNRDVEQRKDQKPQLSDLRESGAIEQDADMVMFIHPEKPAEEGGAQAETLPENSLVEIIVAKHRAGPSGNFKLGYAPHKFLFLNYEHHS